MPRVSIIIPTYNRAAMLKEALESVLAQTYSDYEVLVVDDGSTDNTREVVESLQRPDKIRYIPREHQERSRTRNYGISQARGEYIAFLDSDDMFLPHKLEKQVALMDQHPEYGMSYTSALVVDGEGKPLPSGYLATASGWIYRDIVFFIPVTVTMPTVMVRAPVLDAVGGFDEKLVRFEDTDMWRRIARHCQILAIPEHLSVIRAHAGHMMVDPQKVLDQMKQYVGKVLADDTILGPISRRKGAAFLYYHYGISVLHNREWHPIARRYFLETVRYWPLQLGAYPCIAATYLNESGWAAAQSLWRLVRRTLLFRALRKGTQVLARIAWMVVGLTRVVRGSRAPEPSR